MDEYLRKESEEYIQHVNEICKMIIHSLGLRSKAEFWEFRKHHFYPQLIVHGYRIEFHGRGCRVFSEDEYLDWDFGYGSRWCGINPWLFALTLKKNGNSQSAFMSGEYIHEAFEDAIANNEVYKKEDLYYFVISKEEFVRPEFPKNFDTLVVEQFGKKWILKNDALVKRFIRRSSSIWHHAGESEDAFLLIFYMEKNEVFRIHFDDISYSEGATKTFFEMIKNSQNV